MTYCKRHDFDDVDNCGCPLCWEEKPELSPAKERELVLYFRAELRRVRRKFGALSSPVVVYKPAALRVAVAKPVEHAPMSLPACLCMGDTAASLERRASMRVASHDFWIKTKPVKPEFSRHLRATIAHRAQVAANHAN